MNATGQVEPSFEGSARRAYFRLASEAVFAADASGLSLLHALFYAVGNADLDVRRQTARGARKCCRRAG